MKQNPLVAGTVLKARGVEPQIGDAVSLNAGHQLALFSILTSSCIPQELPPPSHRHTHLYLPSLPEP